MKKRPSSYSFEVMPLSTEPGSHRSDTPSSAALAIERAGQEAAHTAIREHLGSGRAVYYADPAYPSGTVKELPGGRRLLVRLEKPVGHQPPNERAETVLREVEPRRGGATAAATAAAKTT